MLFTCSSKGILHCIQNIFLVHRIHYYFFSFLTLIRTFFPVEIKTRALSLCNWAKSFQIYLFCHLTHTATATLNSCSFNNKRTIVFFLENRAFQNATFLLFPYPYPWFVTVSWSEWENKCFPLRREETKIWNERKVSHRHTFFQTWDEIGYDISPPFSHTKCLVVFLFSSYVSFPSSDLQYLFSINFPQKKLRTTRRWCYDLTATL